MSTDDLAVASLRVQRAFVDSFPSFVIGRLHERGIELSASIIAAIDSGRAWLDKGLSELFAIDPALQRSSPLALFQAALAFPTEALAREGVAPVARDETTERTVPGDRYDLAPASSQSLGEEAWSAHVAWGAAKAKALGAHPRPAQASRRPREVVPEVALFSTDTGIREEIEVVVRRVGLTLAVWRNPGALEAGLYGGDPVVALVDLDHRSADDALRRLGERGVVTLACGSEVDDFVIARALTLGASEVIPKRALTDRLPGLLPRMA
jgi:hypothetical protein